ncbi:DUF6443 domain-containing protein [Fulvivirgaceae bacterium BMA12]|uniref:DUF6443 domain-containing protein n=1 Tax=Agaribacillus aureus TaxID=3051825 RepID=A0ABT8L8F0_9BACT|nr:DUF6443 domain-containing protein [Fulvivirgaceae bacterium BMA12]
MNYPAKKQVRVLLLATSLICLPFFKAGAQCNASDLYVSSSGGCGNNKTLSVFDISVSASSFRWYRRSATGSWQYLGESPSNNGSGSYQVYVTSSTTFGVSYYDNNNWCESDKVSITVGPSPRPGLSASGYSCTDGAAHIQASSSSNISTYYLYKRVNNNYNYIASNSTGSFTVNDFYQSQGNSYPQASDYYVRGVRSGCYSNYSNVSLQVARLTAPSVSGNRNICSGGSTTLTASGGNSYRWYRGNQLIAGATGASYNTGALTTTTNFYVSQVQQVYTASNAVCESPKRLARVTVQTPTPPTPYNKTVCGTSNVVLSASAGFAEYKWYNQANTLLDTTPGNSFSVSAEGLTSYKVKVKNSHGCWSGYSASATVTVTHPQAPYVHQTAPCGPGIVTMTATYHGERNGEYYINWYTTFAGATPAHSVLVNRFNNQATYTVNLSGDRDYWVAVHDPNVSSSCYTPKRQFTARVGSRPTVSASGYSCTEGTAFVQATSPSDISTYYLYKRVNNNYDYLAYNSTGSFTVNDFYQSEGNSSHQASDYYVRGRSSSGCYSNYSNVYLQVVRLTAPSVSGNRDICQGGSTTLTASGGSEGNYRWYRGNQLIAGATGAQYTTGALTTTTNFYVSQVQQVYTANAMCESPKRLARVAIQTPTAPTLVNRTACGSSVVLSASAGFAEYKWYNQANTLLDTTPGNSFSVSAENLTAYSVKVKNDYGCWSEASASATVTRKLVQPPIVSQGVSCGPGTAVPIEVAYPYSTDGDYYVEWYTTPAGSTPVHAVLVSQHEYVATYSPILNQDTDYWVAVRDPNVSSSCRSDRVQFTARTGSRPAVSAEGYSCTDGAAHIQAASPSDITTYYLYKLENGIYNQIASNNTGSFTVNGFYQSEGNASPQASDYYVRGRASSGCYSNYSNVYLQVVRLTAPSVSGNLNICSGGSTTLTASGGTPGNYRWYRGNELIAGVTGASYTTGTLTTTTNFYVSYVEQVYTANAMCESPKRLARVTIQTPTAPTLVNRTACGSSVVLSASAGFAEYKWYNQANTLLDTTPGNSFSVSAENLTAYSVKVKNDYGCWSGYSASATVTRKLTQPPIVSQGVSCGPGTTVPIEVAYPYSTDGDYYVEWYTTPAGSTPVHAVLVSQHEYVATYSPILNQDTDYWVAVRDPNVSSSCRSDRVQFTARTGSRPAVSAEGYSCTDGAAHIQAASPSDITTYYLYKLENGIYNQIASNNTGSFTVNGFYQSEGNASPQASDYYVRGRASSGCYSNYSNVYLQVVRLTAPSVSGNLNICSGGSTTLTASGGNSYRWYRGNELIEGVTGPVFNTGPLTEGASFYVSQVQQVYTANNVTCEGPKRKIDISVIALPETVPKVRGTVTRCDTGAITLEVLGGFSRYQWYGPDGNAMANETTSRVQVQLDELDTPVQYRVTGFSAGGCESGYATITATALSNCENYVHEQLVRVAGITEAPQIANLSVGQKSDTWNYFDGLGRPLQTVRQQASAMGHDIVQPVVYDHLGRQKTEYLSYADNNGSPGYLKTDVLTKQANFYQNAMKVAHDTHPWAEKEFEPSPLNRVRKQGAVGADWQLSTDHVTEYQYKVNQAQENVSQWEYDHASNSITRQASFAGGQLKVNVIIDEQGYKMREYIDKQGLVVLKKVQEADVPGVNHTGWLCTYYVYDDFNRLRAVIPPQAVREMDGANNYSLVNDVTFAKKWLFGYQYDARGRMVEKQVPGADPVYMVYDRWDRLVLTQDGNQRNENEWAFTKYDNLNRPVITGIYMDNRVQDVIRTDVLNHEVRFEVDASDATGYTINRTYPVLNQGDISKLLTITYYDDYGFRDHGNWDAEGNSFTFTAELGYTNSLNNLSYQDMVRGQITGSKIRILGKDTWLNTVIYYDDRYREIQHITETHRGGYSRLTSEYDFIGQLLRSRQTFKRDNSNNTSVVTINQSFTYDHDGRLLATYHRINDQDSVLLVGHDYNELGQQVEKNLHATDMQSPNYFQSVDYRYNIRGWLTHINDSALDGTGIDVGDQNRDYFGQQLFYNRQVPGLPYPASPPGTGLGFTSQTYHNGNISAVCWKRFGEEKQAYAYKYDPVNRLESASYAHGGDGNWNTTSRRFNVGGITYDGNGNIKTLKRHAGSPDATTYVMDNLTYTYQDNNRSNRLQAVSDSAANKEGFDDGATGAVDYDYDLNGNLAGDANKNIETIEYNLLNLPQRILFTNSNEILYTYDAAGVKLRKEVRETVNSVIVKTVTDYMSGVQYTINNYGAAGETTSLDFVMTSEGRATPEDGLASTTGYNYEYNLTDHLGNVRATFTTKEETPEAYKATFETSLQASEALDFQNYGDAVINNVNIYNHTPDTVVSGATRSQRLSGVQGEVIGLAKSLAVVPGDVIDMEVYAKYLDGPGNGPGLGGILATIAEAFGISATSTGDGLQAYNAINGLMSLPLYTALTGSKAASGYQVFLNYLLFDEDYNFLGGHFAQMKGTANAMIDPNVTHELMSKSVTIQKPGYIYIYLSNESGQIVETFFDDFKITHTKSPIISADDYYPFGLAIKQNSYQRESDTEQRYKYNGKELQPELGLNWHDYGARMYDAAIGRWHVVDPLADKYWDFSPYNYTANNPILFIDPDGKNISISRVENENGGYTYTITITGKVVDETGELSSDKLQSVAERIQSALESSLSGSGGNDIWNTTADISVAEAGDEDLSSSDHAFRIVKPGEIPNEESETAKGKSVPGTQVVYITDDIIDRKPAETGSFAGTGLTENGLTTLERVASHETGHNAFLFHPRDQSRRRGEERITREEFQSQNDGRNLMFQARRQSEAGNQIIKEQLKVIYINRKRLNNGIQKFNDLRKD